MAVSTRQLLAVIGALTLSFSVHACSEDTSDPDGNGGDGNGSDGSGGDGNADGNDGDNGGDGSAPKPELGDNVAGKACTEAGGECGEGTCASELTAGAIGELANISIETPGGYCTAACATDATCGEGGVCFASIPAPPGFEAIIQQLLGFIGIDSTDGECRQGCDASQTGQCREGYECAATNEAALADLNAQLRQYIQLPSTCQPAPVPDQLGPNQAGAACDADADCGEGFCNKDTPASADAGTGFPGLGDVEAYPGGYCSGVCTEDAHCGTGGVCLKGLYGTGGTCAESCTTDADCARSAEGYTCIEIGSTSVCAFAEAEPDAGTPGGDDAGATDPDAGTPDGGV